MLTEHYQCCLVALNLPCVVSLIGGPILLEVEYNPFFQNLELLYSSARAVKMYLIRLI